MNEKQVETGRLHPRSLHWCSPSFSRLCRPAATVAPGCGHLRFKDRKKKSNVWADHCGGHFGFFLSVWGYKNRLETRTRCQSVSQHLSNTRTLCVCWARCDCVNSLWTTNQLDHHCKLNNYHREVTEKPQRSCLQRRGRTASTHRPGCCCICS